MMSAERLQMIFLVLAGIAGAVILVTAVRLNLPARPARARSNGDDDETVPGKTARMLRAAGIAVPPLLFYSLVLLVAAVAGMIVVEFSRGLLLAGLLALLAVFFLFNAVVSDLARRRVRRMEEKLADAIDIMAASMRGSENPRVALSSAAEVAPAPVAGELREAVRRLDLGMSIRRAFLGLRTAYDCEGVRLFTSALAAKWTAGGDLAPTLMAVNRVIRDRMRHRLRVRSQFAGARTTSWMVALCPYVALLGIWWLNPEWVVRLFSHFYGPLLFWGAIGLQIIGFLWLRRMVRTEL